ncbi:DUF6153 family protein [Actinomadura scrupuli]|uniref:DUF6153 family protein n=1 Tax=Actinomadura scrupuli TaxID=559629 RepID=UPI003D96D215
MNGRRSQQLPLRIALGGLLLGMLFAGLLAMHGLQASTPIDMAGIPVAGMNTTGMHHPAGTGSAATTRTTGTGSTGAAQGDHEHHAPAPSGPAPDHQHPGGQICLALLIMGFVLALLAQRIVGRRERPSSLVRRTARLLVRCGRPPPSIYQLAVLRL